MKAKRDRRRSAIDAATRSVSLLGPFPVTAVAVLRDLGLTDQEIADYFKVDPQRITALRLKGLPELSAVCAYIPAAEKKP